MQINNSVQTSGVQVFHVHVYTFARMQFFSLLYYWVKLIFLAAIHFMDSRSLCCACERACVCMPNSTCHICQTSALLHFIQLFHFIFKCNWVVYLFVSKNSIEWRKKKLSILHSKTGWHSHHDHIWLSISNQWHRDPIILYTHRCVYYPVLNRLIIWHRQFRMKFKM